MSEQLQEKPPCPHVNLAWQDEAHDETGHIEAGYYCTRCNARFAILPMKDSLKEAQNNLGFVRSLLDQMVSDRRHAGWSWAKISEELGVSRQAAWERFHKEVSDGSADQKES